MKKLLLTGVVLAIAAAAVVGALGIAARRDKDAGAAQTQVVRVTRRDLETRVKATGIVKPMIGAQVRVGSRISGVVSRLYVRVGDTVAKGQILAELDARDLLATQRAAAAALALSEANLTYARADLARKRDLFAADAMAQSDLDLAEQAAAVAEQQRKQAQANLDFAGVQLAYTRITAPIAGVVASVSTQEGETVAASLAAPTFLTLVDLARLEVWAYVDETDIGRIRRGQRARFTVDTYSGHQFDGRVTAIYPQAEIRDNVVDYVTVVRFQTPRDFTLRPEMTTTLQLLVSAREQVLALPLRAIRREGARSFVWCRRAGAPERRWVTIGSSDDTFCEILDGLRQGDEVLVGDVRTE